MPGFDPPDFLEQLQDPTTKIGFWNYFAVVWSEAQCSGHYDPKWWLAIKAYIENLERQIEELKSK
jgi:hypothetical protein